jgi:phage terminase large subunit
MAKKASANISDTLRTVKGLEHSTRSRRAQRKLEELPKPIPKIDSGSELQHKRIVRDFSRCPRCGAPTERCTTISGDVSQFWRECTQCNTYINTYIPQEHQSIFHTDPHKYKGNFGGYGSGKTTTTRQEFYKHFAITPNGTGLIGANISAQYEQTIKRDIEADLPVGLVKEVSVKNSYIEFVNGYRLMFRPFDDPGKLRSLNLDFLAIVEGSEVDDQIFIIGKTRVRNTAATSQKLDDQGRPLFGYTEQGVAVPIIDGDWRTIITESNPDAGWIKTNVLLPSSFIQINGESVDHYEPNPEIADPAISSHVTTTACNQFLPPTYIQDTSKGRPQWWINRYLMGSFTYAEGLVYPSALYNERTKSDHIVPTRQIPRHWKRIHANDYGLSDKTGLLWAAIDEDRGKLVVYKEWYENNRNIAEIADAIKDGNREVPDGGWIRPHIIDPKSGVKRDYNKKSLIDHFLEYGISYTPGQPNVDARVFKLNTMFEQDRIEIMDCCKNLIAELKDYKFPSDDSAESGRKDKPEDKNNHLINPLEWIAMELPTNPADAIFGIYSNRGVNIVEQRKKDDTHYGYYALQETTGRDTIESVYEDIDFENSIGGIF